jgi:dTDP-4-dehydrorhamnose 3,5-epimerase
MMDERALPFGVSVTALTGIADHRGVLTELFRESWGLVPAPTQWTFTTSRAGVLRGAHVHMQRNDLVVTIQGRMDIGLRDIRHGSPTEGLATVVEQAGADPAVVTIPPGVIHGFHFHEPSATIVGFSVDFDPADDLETSWADPELGIPWQATSPILSNRDRDAPPLRDLLARLEPHQPIGGPFPAAAGARAIHGGPGSG